MFRHSLVLFKQSSFSTPLSSSKHLLSHLQETSLPPIASSIYTRPKNLYQHLSALPFSGVGCKVRQRRWVYKGLDVDPDMPLQGPLKYQQDPRRKEEGHLCYWHVTRVRIKNGGNHGKAWGRFVWRGEKAYIAGPKEGKGENQSVNKQQEELMLTFVIFSFYKRKTNHPRREG